MSKGMSMPGYTADHIQKTPETDTCRHCGARGPQVEPPGTGPHHARLRCRASNGVLRWLTTPAAGRRARHWDHLGDSPPTATQLKFLRRLGHTDALPTQVQASPAIRTRLQGQEVAR